MPLIAEIKAKEANNQSAGVLSGQTFDVETQAKLCKQVGQAAVLGPLCVPPQPQRQTTPRCVQVAMDIGFSLEHGRLDVSVHPFTVRALSGALARALARRMFTNT